MKAASQPPYHDSGGGGSHQEQRQRHHSVMGDMRMHANKSTEMNDCEAVTEIDGLFMELIRTLLVD